MPAAFVLVGLVVGTLFVRRQLTLADPMIDVRLFRVPAFSASLAVNFLTIFVAIGYFIFVAQYLQLVLGLSPLEAGVWSVPSAIAFIIGSNAAPRLLRYIRPAFLIGIALGVAAVGLGILSRVGGAGSDGLAIVVGSSVIISLGLAPVFGLTTELVVGSAPPERAGAASGISESAFELGGALGISILGSIGIAIYRRDVADALPAGIPAEAAVVAQDTLGGAVGMAAELPAQLWRRRSSTVAQDAFVQGMQVAAAISGVLAVGVALFAVAVLRNVRADGTESEPEDPEPARTSMDGALADPC